LLFRGHQFESYEFQDHWRLTWSLTSGPVRLVEVRVNWLNTDVNLKKHKLKQRYASGLIFFFNIYINLCFNNDLDRSKCSRTLWTLHSLLISMNLLAYHLVILSIFQVKHLMLRITVNIKIKYRNKRLRNLFEEERKKSSMVRGPAMAYHLSRA
jgi:hypothetical protein